VLEACGEADRRCGDHEHLDVREFIGGAARDAAREHHFLHDGRKRIRHRPGERAQFRGSSISHRREGYADTR
jgi:hypothetical protein